MDSERDNVFQTGLTLVNYSQTLPHITWEFSIYGIVSIRSQLLGVVCFGVLGRSSKSDLEHAKRELRVPKTSPETF